MKMRFLLTALPWFFMTATAIAQHNPSARESGHSHPAAGISIVRFVQIDEGVYKGSKPKTDADFRFLQSKNIIYILDLKFFPLLYRLERNKAKGYGMLVIPATINASPISPSEKHVNHILCILADKRLRPIYLHCDVGRDRTSLIATLYEIYFRGLPPQGCVANNERFWVQRRLDSSRPESLFAKPLKAVAGPPCVAIAVVESDEHHSIAARREIWATEERGDVLLEPGIRHRGCAGVGIVQQIGNNQRVIR